jgi:DNA-binding SARP family transcriptional activator
VRIHLAEGNLHEARRAYQTCVELLHNELGIPPSPAMGRLLQLQDIQRAVDIPATVA